MDISSESYASQWRLVRGLEESPKSITGASPEAAKSHELDLHPFWADIPMTSPRIPEDLYFFKPCSIFNRVNNGIRKDKKNPSSLFNSSLSLKVFQKFTLKFRKNNKKPIEKQARHITRLLTEDKNTIKSWIW